MKIIEEENEEPPRFSFYDVLSDEYGAEGIDWVAQLTGLTEHVSSTLASDVYSRGVSASGT